MRPEPTRQAVLLDAMLAREVSMDVPASSLRHRVEALLDDLGDGLIERREILALVVLAALTGEHVLLIGPPGTAKSELARRLTSAFTGARGFERLLTRFSVPEELFGPLSIKGLEQDRYERLVAGYLPDAHIVFLDEIFKANSAILNALLSLLEERRFDNGRARLAVPLVTVIGASNELPDGAELAALHDRFLVRLRVEPVSPEGFDALLSLPDARPVMTAGTLGLEELVGLRARAARVELTPVVRGALGAMREALRKKGVVVSDRRFRKIALLLRMAALIDERSAVGLGDLAIVAHCVWDRPEQIGAAREALDGAIAALLAEEPARFRALVESFEESFDADRTRQEHQVDEAGRLIYLDESGTPTSEPFLVRPRSSPRGDPLYIAPPGFSPDGLFHRHGVTFDELWKMHFVHVPQGLAALERYAGNKASLAVDRIPRAPVMIAARFGSAHVEGRARQVRSVSADFEALAGAISVELSGPSERASLFGEIATSRAVRENLAAAKAALDPLRDRFARVLEGFLSLPRAEAGIV